MKRLVLLLAMLFLVSSLSAGTIAGKVTSKETGQALAGANVYIKGTTVGAATDEDGMYRIKIDDGTYTVLCDYVGYSVAKKEVEVSGTVKVDFALTEYLFSQTINVVADRARERETPVAFSDVSQEAMETRLGSRDIPLVLNTTPSVYATQGGGGAGDARINIRGFNQRNVAIMINGVPVNDMENGWVYWSNWDGVGDATSSIQVQRGLSAVNLATPSIGGTMNIITNPAIQQAGFQYKHEIGSGDFSKSTFFGHTGLIDGKYAFSGGLVRKTGTGIVDRTWTDAWAYYLGASYNLNEDNRLEFYALGAPQRHGQNLYKQNIGTYSHSFARDLDDYDPAALDKFKEQGPYFNQNWSPVSSSYRGSQYWSEDYDQRYDPSFLMERENFYHKPQVNLNWYSRLSDRLSLYSILYYSGGHGGGTGTYGDVYRRDANGVLGDDDHRFYFGPSPWTWDWDATIAANQGDEGYYVIDQDSLYKEDGQSLGILRNSRNNQWTVGAISKAYYKLTDNLNTSFGIDWRTAEIEHYREVRDLLGGEFWVKTADEFNPNEKVGLGDKVAYNFTNTVDWLGAYGQGEWTQGPVTAYAMAAWSTIKYGYTNHFRKAAGGGELTADTDWIHGLQLKGGASYRLTNEINAFGNVGYVSKVPIFDAVISDRDGSKAEDPQNEKFTSLEAGVNYRGLAGKLFVKSNV
ncbi:MAG: TonB-dependent receptor plug domain-containing protein, partial [Caldithrix sp.]|nr:TonB-dependent receptor plug domain-containing protein [Caldithrix sp.]